MSDYLERLERQLVAAIDERVAAIDERAAAGTHRSGARSGAREGVGPRRSTRRALPAGLLAAALILLIGAAVAIAITGVLAPGSAVRLASRPVPSAGTGVPLPGRTRLLVQAPDPAGGPTWGMRVVHTTRGLECIQLGRVENGQLGLLGIDGAFGEDGRFHPLPPDVLGRGRGVQAFVTCLAPGQHTAMEAGLSLSGAWGVGGRHARGGAGSPATSRWISFGLLGPHAVSVSYPAAGGVHTLAVEPGAGAYLIALANPRPDLIAGAGGATGEGILAPQGAVSLITYRVRGRVCAEPNLYPHGPRGGRRLAHCPRPSGRIRRPTVRKLHHRIGVRRLANGDVVVTFTAPYPVTSATDQYSVQIPYTCRGDFAGIPLERDVRAGEVVHMRVRRAFASACGASLAIQVDYMREGGRYGFDPRAAIVVGEARVGSGR